MKRKVAIGFALVLILLIGFFLVKVVCMFATIPFMIERPESGQLSWDTVKLIIQSQHNLAIYGITALVAVAILIAGASWFTNFYLVRRELEETIDSLWSELTTKEEDFKKTAESIKENAEKMMKETKKDIEEKLIAFDADKSRLFAISAFQMGAFESEAYWWANAIKGYAESNAPGLLRIAVDRLNDALGKCKKLKDRNRKQIKEGLSFIPIILRDEKEQIENKLKGLPKEKEEASA